MYSLSKYGHVFARLTLKLPSKCGFRSTCRWIDMNGKLKSQQLQVRCIRDHQSTLALALDMWLLELGMHISRYISSPSRVQPVPWFKTSSTRKGWGIPVDIESGYPIFHLQPRCKRGIYASGIGTTLVGSKFSQSSGRLRGLGLAYSPNKGRRFDFFYQ